MNIFYSSLLLTLSGISLIHSHTHDEIAKCTLTGVHKTRQTVLESPNYPNSYSPGTCWDYVIRSPYRCPTKFHIQFLDFFLETSKDCENDYLAIGLDNVDDDMDVLCGQVVGIKKYHTPDGVIRLRFYAGESSGASGKGFKLLITRLACEKEELLRELETDGDDDDDTITVTAPAEHLKPPQTQIMEIFRNLSAIEQHQLYPMQPVFGLNYPTQLPSPTYPGYGGFYLPSQQALPQQYNFGLAANTLENPCRNQQQQQIQLQQQPQPHPHQQQQQTSYIPNFVTNYNSYIPAAGEQYVGAWFSSPANPIRARDGSSPSQEACCTSGFQQKRFYLSSPGFPRTIFSNLLPIERRDCVFNIQKHKGNVCRLRLDFKFFDFGQSYHGTGTHQGNIGMPAIETSRNTCTEDYIDIDNERFCGCRSDHITTVAWNHQGDKKIRMRMGYSGIPSGGFLLEITQEECSATQFTSTTNGQDNANNPNRILSNYPQSQGFLPPQQSGIIQQSGYPQYSGLPQQIGFPPQANSLQQQYPNQVQQTLAQQPFISPQGFSSNPQQNRLQQHPHIPNNLYLPLSQAVSPYPGYQQHPLAPQNQLQTNPFGLQQLRYARSYDDSKYLTQPLSVVETNSTRKEYYFTDSSSNSNKNSHIKNPNLDVAMSRSSRIEGFQPWEEEDVKAQTKAAATRTKCSFDMGDILRLSVDVLWLTKPTCYAPQRSWLTNLLG